MGGLESEGPVVDDTKRLRATVKEVYDTRRRGYNNLMLPNEHFSPERARELYAMYFDELVYCTETGFVTREVIPAVKAHGQRDARG